MFGKMPMKIMHGNGVWRRRNDTICNGPSTARAVLMLSWRQNGNGSGSLRGVDPILLRRRFGAIGVLIGMFRSVETVRIIVFNCLGCIWRSV